MSSTSSYMTKLFVIMTISFVIIKNDFDVVVHRKIPGWKLGRYQPVE